MHVAPLEVHPPDAPKEKNAATSSSGEKFSHATCMYPYGEDAFAPLPLQLRWLPVQLDKIWLYWTSSLNHGGVDRYIGRIQSEMLSPQNPFPPYPTGHTRKARLSASRASSTCSDPTGTSRGITAGRRLAVHPVVIGF